MSHDLSLQGQTVNYWTVIRPDGQMPYATPRAAWIAQCRCGTVRRVCENNLKKRATKSCGCLQRETAQEKSAMSAPRRTEYTRWSNMVARCTKQNNKDWPNYGGRGIKVCDRWMSFGNFFSDMGVAPKGMTIDRIDANGDYEPSNCRWATVSEQARNKRVSKILIVDGVSKTQSEWAADLGVFPALIAARLRLGWSIKDACTKKPSGAKHEAVLHLRAAEAERKHQDVLEVA